MMVEFPNSGSIPSTKAHDPGSSLFIPNEEDVDSDVLSDSSDEDEEVEQTKENNLLQQHLAHLTPKRQASAPNYSQVDVEIEQYLNENYGPNESPAVDEDEDEQIYQLFMQSIRDDHIAESIIGTSDDDDEEYNPDPSDEDGDDDDGDDDDEGNFNDVEDDYDYTQDSEETQSRKVHPWEIRDLLNECWLEIAGNKPAVPRSFNASDGGNNSSTVPSTSQSTAHNIPHSSQINHPYEDTPSATKPPSNLISSVVSQLITGQKSSEAFIDSLPLSAIRKIVARQMSMALQLLIQMMLQADDHSECFDKCYQQLLILSNLRNSAVKKAKLFEMNLQLLKDFSYPHQHPQSEFQQILRNVAPQMHHSLPSEAQIHPQSTTTTSSSHFNQASNVNNNSSSNPGDNRNPESTLVNYSRRIMTRSSLTNHHQLSDRTASIFDIPILSKIHEFTILIDMKKREIQQQLLPFKNMTISSGLGPNARHHPHHNPYAHHHHQSRSLLLSTYPPTAAATSSPFFEQQLKLYKFLLYEQSIKDLYQQSLLKCWNCLIPKANYPFIIYNTLLLTGSSPSSSAASSFYPTNTTSPAVSSIHYSLLNPTTIEGRKFFTPAEDDLLLKGIIEFGDDRLDSWSKIQQKYLTDKKLELLQFHYHEKTLFYYNNDFKRYQYYLERLKISMTSNSHPVVTASTTGLPSMNATPSMGMQALGLVNPRMLSILQSSHANSTTVLGSIIAMASQHSNLTPSQRKKEEKWTPIEELCLLRGFQIFGDKYPLTALFLLPHRSAIEVKNRWTYLQTIWTRAFNVQRKKFLSKHPMMTIRYDQIPVMSTEIQAFLRDINDCKDIHHLSQLWMNGGGEEMRGLKDFDDRKLHSKGMNLSGSENQNSLMTLSKEPSIVHQNQINWTSIMDNVSDFEQDTLPDSSDEEGEDDPGKPHSGLTAGNFMSQNKFSQPSLPVQEQQQDHSRYLTTHSVPTQPQPYPNNSSSQFYLGVNQPFPSNAQSSVEPSKTFSSKGQMKKRKDSHDSSSVSLMEVQNKSAKKQKLNPMMKDLNSVSSQKEGPSLSIGKSSSKPVQVESTQEMIHDLLINNATVATRSDQTMTQNNTQPKDSTSMSDTNAQSKLLFDEYSLDFTKLFKEESNLFSNGLGNHSLSQKDLPPVTTPNQGTNLSQDSNNSNSNSGLFASVMMNLHPK